MFPLPCLKTFKDDLHLSSLRRTLQSQSQGERCKGSWKVLSPPTLGVCSLPRDGVYRGTEKQGQEEDDGWSGRRTQESHHGPKQTWGSRVVREGCWDWTQAGEPHDTVWERRERDSRDRQKPQRGEDRAPEHRGTEKQDLRGVRGRREGRAR